MVFPPIVLAAGRVWDAAKKRDPNFTSANVCWWFAMYGSSDFTVTPRPAYPADGRKIPDVHAQHRSFITPELAGQIGVERGLDLVGVELGQERERAHPDRHDRPRHV